MVAPNDAELVENDAELVEPPEVEDRGDPDDPSKRDPQPEELGAGDSAYSGTLKAVAETGLEKDPKRRERKMVVTAFVTVYTVVLLGAFAIYAYLLVRGDAEDAAIHLNNVVSVVVASVGPILGFYFGQQHSGK